MGFCPFLLLAVYRMCIFLFFLFFLTFLSLAKPWQGSLWRRSWGRTGVECPPAGLVFAAQPKFLLLVPALCPFAYPLASDKEGVSRQTSLPTGNCATPQDRSGVCRSLKSGVQGGQFRGGGGQGPGTSRSRVHSTLHSQAPSLA